MKKFCYISLLFSFRNVDAQNWYTSTTSKFVVFFSLEYISEILDNECVIRLNLWGYLD